MVFGRRTVGDSELNGVGYGFGVGLSYFELRKCRSGPDPGCLRPGKNDRASCEGRCGDESDELDRWGAADSGPVWHGARAGQVDDVDNDFSVSTRPSLLADPSSYVGGTQSGMQRFCVCFSSLCVQAALDTALTP